jgi:hypothetical protein
MPVFLLFRNEKFIPGAVLAGQQAQAKEMAENLFGISSVPSAGNKKRLEADC